LSCDREEKIRDGNCNTLLTVRSDQKREADDAGEDRAISLCKEWHLGTSGKFGLGSRVPCGKEEDITAYR
jgi:hypothetical protein